jgi:hypothetical protein
MNELPDKKRNRTYETHFQRRRFPYWSELRQEMQMAIRPGVHSRFCGSGGLVEAMCAGGAAVRPETLPVPRPAVILA